jgi:hypothetical protein
LVADGGGPDGNQFGRNINLEIRGAQFMRHGG